MINWEPQRVRPATPDPSLQGGEKCRQTAHDPHVAQAPSPERVARYRRGRFSELLAAAALIAKGYRILGRRVKTPFGEIDLIALRGRRIAFVEVKRRTTRLEAEAAIARRQAGRIARAAEFWISRHPRYRDHDRGLDAMLVVPGRFPVHLRNALVR
jgi:putative endonuclease